MVYVPSVFHGPNLGSNTEIKPLPIYYQWKLLFALGAVAAGAYQYDQLPVAYGALGLLALVVIQWLRVWTWTCYLLFPPFLRSEYYACRGRWDVMDKITVDTSDYLIINNPAYNTFKTHKIPLFVFIEAYRRGDVSVVDEDLPRAFENMYDWGMLCLNWEYAYFLLVGYIFDVFVHSRVQDVDQVRGHYDLGNDFFGWYLGHRMVYTSGYYLTGDESLEQAQDQKMEVVARKIGLRPGHKVLDLGCGWGTWTLYSASKWGTETTGLSIAREQIKFATDRQETNKITGANWVCRDYRDMPRRPRFDRITCFEMAEHVGVKRFQEFLHMVWDALEDDGVFYLQIAGLREKWQYEEVVWGLFMWKYIFRGADASLPLNWVVMQLEQVGFVCQSVENIDCHYTTTIRQWRDNWASNKDQVYAKYGGEMHRIWDIFLSWSPLIGDRGGSTCWQIVCYKNLDEYKRRKFMGALPNAYKNEVPFDDLKSAPAWEASLK